MAKGRTRNHHFGRYRQIALVLIKYRLADLIRTFNLDRFLPFRWVPPGNPWAKKEVYTRSQRTRMAMEELGTTFIKVGQILSTRNDIMPSDYVEELTKLQDSLTPLPLATIEKVISDEFGQPVGAIFTSFEPNPLGVASIGQVHAAILKDGTEVVVKVQKTGVKEQVTEDLEILQQMATSAAQHSDGWQNYNLTSLVEEIADTLRGELDYVREGHSAEHFARFFKGDPSVHVPKIFWEYTTPRVITLERIRGINILDISSLDKAGFNRKELAKRSAGVWIKMVFENSVFHADPHPGNLFVETDGRLGLVDFGMIGLVDDEVRINIATVVKGILDRDVDLLLESLIDLGAITPAGSKESLRRDLKHMMAHYPLLAENLDISSDFSDLFTIVRNNHIQLPGNTFLLLKTLTMAQSLGQRLDKDFNFFELLAPSVDNLVHERYRPSKILRRLPPAIAELSLLGAGLPMRISRILKSIERGEFHLNADVSGVEVHLEHLERLVNRAIIGLIIAAVIFALAIAFLVFRLGV